MHLTHSLSASVHQTLRAPQALAAIQALVTCPVANRYVAATRARRGILLVGNHRRQVSPAIRMPVPVAIPFHLNGRVFGNRQFRDRTVYFFFQLFEEPGHREFRLCPAGRGDGVAVTGNKLQREPAKHVVNDGRRVTDFRILRETARLEALVRKFL
jgi:hypothetical protein